MRLPLITSPLSPRYPSEVFLQTKASRTVLNDITSESVALCVINLMEEPIHRHLAHLLVLICLDYTDSSTDMMIA